MSENEKWELNDIKQNTIDDMLGEGETVLYRTKPKKSAYIWSAVLRMFPIALIWLAFDGGFLAMMFTADGGFADMPTVMTVGIICFFAFHLMPVWIWLGGIIKAALELKNVDYAFTDKRIIIRRGIIGIDFKLINYNEIDSVDVKVGLIDRILKVGDIYIKHGGQMSVIYDVSYPYSVLSKLQKTTLDIKADIHYPNDLRPSTNHGYNTKYEG